MGQYRKWLQHREIDQILQAQLTALEAELAQLDEQIQSLSPHRVDQDNVVINALQAFLSPQQAQELQSQSSDPVSTPSVAPTQTGKHRAFKHRTPARPTKESLSSAMQVLEQLSHVNTSMSSQSQPAPASSTPTPISLSPSQDQLPQDIRAFIMQYSQELGRVPPRSINEKKPVSRSGPVDHSSVNTNQNVQRWFARRPRLIQPPYSDQEHTK